MRAKRARRACRTRTPPARSPRPRPAASAKRAAVSPRAKLSSPLRRRRQTRCKSRAASSRRSIASANAERRRSAGGAAPTSLLRRPRRPSPPRRRLSRRIPRPRVRGRRRRLSLRLLGAVRRCFSASAARASPRTAAASGTVGAAAAAAAATLVVHHAAILSHSLLICRERKLFLILLLFLRVCAKRGVRERIVQRGHGEIRFSTSPMMCIFAVEKIARRERRKRRETFPVTGSYGGIVSLWICAVFGFN